ncbi:MAG: right-handed parallel beta-helix repeat-containing protein, partial [Desulfatitalea sp.]
TSNDATTILEHCTIQYAGSGGQGSVNLQQASPTIRNTTIANSSGYAINIANGAPTIDGCQFNNNGNYDLWYSGTVGGSIANSTINNGIYLQATGSVGFTANTLNQNNTYPIKVYADNVGPIVNGCTFNNVTGASYLEITSGNVTKDATWTAAIPYVLSGYSFVQGTDGADAITTLTISPGAVLKFNQGRYLNIGAASGSPGALIAQGTAANPILFTSNQATPTAGYWNQIKFDDTANDGSTFLSHCVFEYGGSGSQGMLNLSNAKPTIAYCNLRYSSHAGINVTGSGSTGATINCNTFSNNLYGLYVSNALPLIQQNNFNANTNYGLYYSSAGTLNAEDNWWGAAAGPNTTGDRTYGNVDAEPWSNAENQCIVSGANHPPNTPNTPNPADNAVRVTLASASVSLQWSGDDPDVLDTVTYTLRWGTSAGSLVLLAANIETNQYSVPGLTQGATYYWQVTAKDNGGLEAIGPVWHFTTNGDPPDLVVASLSTNPAGHLQAGQGVSLTAQVRNLGTGPVVDAFSVGFKVDGAVIANVPVTAIIPAGGTVPVIQSWTYSAGNPSLEVTADAQSSVAETNEQNNRLIALLSEVADNTPPAIVSTAPSNGSYLQQLQAITLTMADSQSAIDDAAVLASHVVRDGNQQPVAGTKTEANDTFTFTPNSLPMADGAYQVSLTAADIYGNTQVCGFDFTIDTQPPGKPIITGGTVASGTIQPRPTQNSSEQFIVTLTGTREAGTSVWINGTQMVAPGQADWSVQLTLQPGANATEVWLADLAGNRGVSEWVDLLMLSETGIHYQYNEAGRMKKAF